LELTSENLGGEGKVEIDESSLEESTTEDITSANSGFSAAWKGEVVRHSLSQWLTDLRIPW
jgi:hypothetical protein